MKDILTGGGIALPNVSLVEENMSLGYAPYVPHDYSQDYLTTVVTADGNVKWRGTENNALSYSIDDGVTWSTASNSITLPVNKSDKVLWKGITTPSTSYPHYGIGAFSGDDNVRYTVEGNVMSLLFGDNFKEQTSLDGKNYILYRLFCDNTNITSAENLLLPVTTLTQSCYANMFQGCTNLTTAPSILPATKLSQYCYNMMFYGCTSLIAAPKLPATTLARECYIHMFRNCTSLTTAPELPATTLQYGCYENMFNGCTNLNSITCLATDINASRSSYYWVSGVAASGTFTKASSMSSWTTGVNGIPSGWTVQDAA